MNDLVDKILEEQSKDEYTANIEINLVSEGYELLDNKVTVNFSIDIEYRSWGIKDITIKPIGIIEFDVSKEDERTIIKIDADDLQMESEKGFDFIKPLWLNVEIDSEGNVVRKVLHISR